MRMQATRQRDTMPELRLRKLLHAKGLRYSVDSKPLEDSPRRADIVFRRARIAVFADACFRQGCPEHGIWPRANEAFWRAKIIANQARDADTNDRLIAYGWLVIHVWEHEDPSAAAACIARSVHERVGLATERRSSP